MKDLKSKYNHFIDAGVKSLPKSYAEFEAAMKDKSGGAQKIYDGLKNEGVELPDFNEFYSVMMPEETKVQPAAKPQVKPATQSQQAVQPSTPKAGTPMTDSDKKGMMANAEVLKSNIETSVDNTAQRLNNLAKVNQPLKTDVKLGTQVSKVGDKYITTAGNDYDTPEQAKVEQFMIDESQSQRKREVDMVRARELEDDINKEKENLKKIKSTAIKTSGGFMPSDGGYLPYDPTAASESEKKIRELEQERRKVMMPMISEQLTGVNSRIETLNEEINNLKGGKAEKYSFGPSATNRVDDNVRLKTKELSLAMEERDALELMVNGEDNNFFSGLIYGITRPSTYTFGLYDLAMSQDMLNAKNAYDKGALTDEQKQFMAAYEQASTAKAELDSNADSTFRFGNIAAQSAPFMLEFFGTGGMGGIQAAATSLAKRTAVALTKNMAKGMAKNFTRGFIKNTGIALGDIAAAGTMAVTTGGARTASDIINRYTGHPVQTDKGFTFKDGTTLADAIYKGLTGSTIEYYTEMLGTHMESVFPWIKSVVGKRMSQFAENVKGTKMGFAMAYGSIGLKKLGELADKSGIKAIYNDSKKAMKLFGLQSYPYEALEEEAGIVLNSMLTGDNKISDLIDGRTQEDIWGGMLYSIGMMQGITGGYSAIKYYGLKHKLSNQDVVCSNLFGDQWASIKEQIDNATNANLLKTIFNVRTKSAEERKALLVYGGVLSQFRGFNSAVFGETEDKAANNTPSNPVSNAVNRGFTDGYNSTDEETARIENDLNDKKGLLNYDPGMSESEQFQSDVVRLQDNQEDALDYLIERYGEQHIGLATDYYNALNVYNGLTQRKADEDDDRLTHLNQQAERNEYKGQEGQSGNVITADMGGNKVYIVRGDVNTETGEMSGAIVVRDEQGKIIVTNGNALTLESVRPLEEIKQENAEIVAAERLAKEQEMKLAEEQQQEEQQIDQQQQPQDQPQDNQEQPQDNQEQQQDNQEQPQEPIEEMPMIGEGEEAEPDFYSVAPSRSRAFIYDESDLSEDEANEYVDANIEESNKKVKSLEKKKPKASTSITKYKKELEAWKQELEQAKKKADYWQQVKMEQSNIIATKQEERRLRDEAENKKAVEEELQRQQEITNKRKEQVSSMKHPRVLFVTSNEMPYNADTFSKFNAQDKKAQSRTEQSIKLGKTVDDSTFERIVQLINTFDSIADFYNNAKATAEAISELQKAGVINAMQYAEMFDSENVSGIGRQMLENMLVGKFFQKNPEAIRQLSEIQSLRQNVISALAEISNNRKLGNYSLERELAQAIDLAYQARKHGFKHGDKVSGYARQMNLFPFEMGETVADYTNATILMLANILNDKRTNKLKNTLTLYNRSASDSAIGQMDLFTGSVRTKEEIIKDILKLLDNGTKEEQESAINDAVERRKADSNEQDDAVRKSVEKNDKTSNPLGRTRNRNLSKWFGPIYTQFEGKANEAESHLRATAEGVAKGALVYPGVSPIDLVWGDMKAGYMKIVIKHPEVVGRLQEILSATTITSQSDNRIVFESDTHKMIVSRMKGSQPTDNWLLTAYEKKEKPVSASSSDIETEPEGKRNGTATPQNGASSADKVTNTPDNNQGETEKKDESKSGVKESRVVGGNSGYVGYSMSKRAAQAREEGRFPKTDFKKVYGLSGREFDMLVSTGIIDDSEWHHTSKFGNKTTFYSWAEDVYAEIYAANKKEIDAIAKKYNLKNQFEEPSLSNLPKEYLDEYRKLDNERWKERNALRDEYKDVEDGPRREEYLEKDRKIMEKYDSMEKELEKKYPEYAAYKENEDNWRNRADEISRDRKKMIEEVRSLMNEKERDMEMRDVVIELLQQSGIEVITNEEEAQRVLDEAYRMLDNGDIGEHKLRLSYYPRLTISPVRGKWTKSKIIKRLKDIVGTKKGYSFAARRIAEFDSAEELAEHMFYHGSQFGGGRLKPSILMSDSEVERIGGGGYGQKYWGISVSRSKRIASNFSTGTSVRVYPIILVKNAKIKEMPELSDAADLEDYIEDLWEEGVDAVWIGDKNRGEQELCVINPAAIVNIDNPDIYNYYKLGTSENPINIIDKDGINKLYQDAKRYVNALENKPKKPEKPSRFLPAKDGEMIGEKKSDEQYQKEMSEYERKLDEYNNSDEVRRFQQEGEYAYRNIRFFKTPSGHAYGFTVDGKIYVDKRIAGAETPIHEYTHLWAAAMRQVNPEEWKNIVNLMKGTTLWEEVKKMYPELTTDDDIADEVLAHYSGKRGAERLKKAQEEAMKQGGLMDKAAALSAIYRVKEALSRFWKGVADFLGVHFTSAEEVADKVLSDLLNGVNPAGVAKNSEVRYQSIGEKGLGLNYSSTEGNPPKVKDGFTLYVAKDGSKIVSRSLFRDEGFKQIEAASEDASKGRAVRRKTVFSPARIRLRKLKEGETCSVERRYVENGMFDFTGKEKIESDADVAYIFRQLENAAVENCFMVLLKDGRPTVIHLSMGSYSSTMAPFEQAFVAYSALKPDEVYFVHNHPSGNLKASRQDRDMLDRMKKMFGSDVVNPGIIIDTTSGKYGVFDDINIEEDMPVRQEGEVPLKVYNFSKQVFSPGWNPMESFKIKGPDDVAAFVSSHRLGEHEKMSFLVLGNDNSVVANVFLPYTKLSDIEEQGELKSATDMMAGYVHQCGGTRGIIYGNYDYTSTDGKLLSKISLRMKELGAPLLDAIHIEHSAMDEGVIGEPVVDGISLETVNKRFNNELERYQNREMASSEMLHLGNPRGVMRKFLPNIPIVMRQRILNKGAVKKHNVDVSSLSDMPQYLSSPIFVFQRNDNTLGVLTEMKDRDGKNVYVAIEINRQIQDGGDILEVNDIRSVHGRNIADIIYPIINNETLKWVDKEKGLSYLSSASRYVQQEIDKKDLISATKVVKEFKNPIIEEDKNDLKDEILTRAGSETDTISGKESVKSPQKPIYTEAQKEGFAKQEKRRVSDAAREMAARLGIEDDVEFIETNEDLTGREATAKGWFNRKTGKIVVVLGNHISQTDVLRTIIHEGVAHYGLRKLLGERFDTFLDEVFKNAEQEVKESILELSKKHGYNVRTATEEYLASLAEKMDFEKAKNSGWWMKIKSMFLDMMRQLGLGTYVGPALTDNELRYLLWRSYENLAEPNRYNNPFAEAKDTSKQLELKVGGYENRSGRVNTTSEKEGDLLFRDGDFTERDEAIARDAYENAMRSGRVQFIEEVQDSMRSLVELYKAILGKKTRVEDIEGFENPYMFENRLSSMNMAQQHLYFIDYMKPVLKAISRICKGNDKKREELINYMMAKHGLERNLVFAERDAKQKAMEEFAKELKAAEKSVFDDPLDANAVAALDDVKIRMQQREEELFFQNREKDYGGITGLMGIENLKDAEEAARTLVDDYEWEHDLYITDLWDAVNAATQATLEKIYESGIISKESYENIRDMFEYYIPLQGWDETTSDEVYAYLIDRKQMAGAPIKHAKGRRSKADDPIATIGMRGEMAVMQANRNLMKQTFLNFVLDHPSDLVSVSELWLEHDEVNDVWIPVFVDIEEGDTGEDIKRKTEAFEQQMEALQKQDPKKYKKSSQAQNIPYKVVPGNLKAHQVIVKRNGKSYVLTINGNPKAAMALNGLTNPDVEQKGFNKIMNAATYVNRKLSIAYTTANINFTVSNFVRDMVYSNTMAWIKESPWYALNFHWNCGKYNPAMLRRLFGKWENETLDLNNKTEKLFYDFMKNGGETGFSNIRDIDAQKKFIISELKKENSLSRKAIALLTSQLDMLNRSVENTARFAAFVTSREVGRSVERSVYDAKEVSVNFNKKGSGGRFLGEKGQTALGNVGSVIGGSGRIGYVFWNAGIQGLSNIGKNMGRHKIKGIAGLAAMYVLGRVIPMLYGDDDDNSYYDIPEKVRRSNICIKVGEQWVTISLPIEFRAIYGLGELATGVESKNDVYTDKELAYQIGSQISQILPIDFLEGDGGVKNFVPTLLRPSFEAYINESWTGLPIYKDTPWNKNMPGWTKAYKNANVQLVDFAKFVSEITGGDEYKKGAIDINPAQVEHVLSGLFGGYVIMGNQLIKMAETATGERDFDWRNMIIANRVITNGDERVKEKRTTGMYYKIKEEVEEKRRLINSYRKDEMDEKADKLETPEYENALEDLKESQKNIKQIKEMIDETSDKDIQKELNKLIRQEEKTFVERHKKILK